MEAVGGPVAVPEVRRAPRAVNLAGHVCTDAALRRLLAAGDASAVLLALVIAVALAGQQPVARQGLWGLVACMTATSNESATRRSTIYRAYFTPP